MYINVIKSTHANSAFRYWGNLYVNAWVYIVYTIYMQIYTVSCSLAAVVCTIPGLARMPVEKIFAGREEKFSTGPASGVLNQLT